MDDHDAKTEKHEPKAAVLQAAKSGVLKSTNQAMHGDEAKDKQDVPDCRERPSGVVSAGLCGRRGMS